MDKKNLAFDKRHRNGDYHHRFSADEWRRF